MYSDVRMIAYIQHKQALAFIGLKSIDEQNEIQSVLPIGFFETVDELSFGVMFLHL